MIRLRHQWLRNMKGLPKYYLSVVKLILLLAVICLILQPLLYTSLYYSIHSYVDTPTKDHIPAEIILLVSPENASRILDEEIDHFRDQNLTKIPKIIHQIYAHDLIPDVYVSHIKTWVKNHPGYEYWLWDDVSARMLIEKHYRKFLPLYDSYCHDLFRSDAVRYFLLHKYGGIYMDMDYVSYRNIEPLLKDRQCSVVAENSAQSKMIYRVPDMVMNAFMASVPGHPYMRYLINSLPSSASCHFHDVLVSTGPIFIYKARKTYLEITRCNILEGCYVHILPDDKMMRSWDPDAVKIAKKHCRKNSSLTALQMESCEFFIKNGFSIEKAEPGDAYADHLFLHLGNYAKNYKALKRINIRQIVPHVVIPSEGKL